MVNSAFTTSNSLPTPEFWRYSLKLYSKIAVKNICLELEQIFDINVNVLLLCCWYSAAGYGVISKQTFNKIDQETNAWHQKITKALRELRSILSNLPQHAWAQEIRKEILAHELTAEHIEQLIILDNLPLKKLKNRSNQQRISDCIENFHHYLTSSGIVPDKETYELLNKLVGEVFRFKSEAHKSLQSKFSI